MSTSTKPKLIGLGAVAGIIGIVCGYSAYHERHLQNLYDSGHYIAFLQDAPKGDERWETLRMKAIAAFTKGRCNEMAPELRRKVAELQSAGKWQESLDVPESAACARYDDKLAALRAVAPKKINEIKLTALYGDRGGKRAFLEKLAAVERTNPKQALELVKPFKSLDDRDITALANKAATHQTTLDRAENARTIRLAARKPRRNGKASASA